MRRSGLQLPAGVTLENFDEDAFLAVAPTLTIIEINAGVSQPLGLKGELFFDTDDDRDNFIFLATRSSTGVWFCTGADLFQLPAQGAGTTFNEIGNSCYPTAFAGGD